ncbi:hypothetical protein F-VV10_0314 [Faustovirus]|nr:hypothetical protein F-VV10_0314 [Faustovirus]
MCDNVFTYRKMSINNNSTLVTINITIGPLENDNIDKFEIIEHDSYAPTFPCNVIQAITPGAINAHGSESSYQDAGWFWPESGSWFGRYVPNDVFNTDMPFDTKIRYTHNPVFCGRAGDVFNVYTCDGVKITFKLNIDIEACNYCGFCYNVLNSVYYKYAAIRDDQKRCKKIINA